MRIPHPLLIAFGSLVWLAPAQAQLELPKGQNGERPKVDQPAQGHLPHLECLTCGKPNYVTTIEPAADKGEQKAWCLHCRNVRLFQRVEPAGGKQGGGLDLPEGSDPSETPQPTPAAKPVVSQVPSEPASSQDRAAAVAQSVFVEVGSLKSPDPAQVHSAAETLVALGDPGLAQARLQLIAKEGVPLWVATRALLLGGNGEDAQRVGQRMQQSLPPKTSGALIKQVIELSPVVASPKWLASLLDHPQKPARLAAYRQLKKLAKEPSLRSEDWLGFLTPHLSSKHSDAAYRALDVIADLGDPAAVPHLLETLGHRKAKVARRAVDILTPLEDPRIDPELLVRTFGSQWILRKNAYALLTLIEREDHFMEPRLHQGHVETLLHAMDRNDEMVQNTAALALAGIGFRMEGHVPTPWLDQSVMERLVGVAAAIRFFEDRSSLVEPCLRRLQLLSGRNFGENGPEWAEWWLTHRRSFRASRAAMSYSADDHTGMLVEYAHRPEGLSFQLLGPERMGRPAEVDGPQPYYLTKEQAVELGRLLEEQGVLGAGQLPGPRGAAALRGQELTVRLGAGAKSFALGPDVLEPWFETVAQYLRALRDQCIWQEFYDPQRFADQRAWVQHVLLEGGVPSDPMERSAWECDVYLTWLESQPPGKRERGLRALVQSAETGQGPTPMEFDRLMALLGQEVSFTRDARQLFRLTLESTGLEGHGASDPEAALLGERLLGTLAEHYGWKGIDPMSQVLQRLGAERARLAREDSLPVLRAAGGLYALRHSGADGAEWLTLLQDSNPQVVAQILEAAGHENKQVALPAALQLAATGVPEVRHVALRTLGRLGGTDAREGLMLALTDPSGEYRVTAAEGLADLRDPQAAPLMVALLRNGRQQGIQDALRRGLTDLGSKAHDPLLDALQSPHPFTRREAALLLGRQDVARATPALLRLLSEDSTDSEVVDVLVGLTCVDLSRAVDRSTSWWNWWDSVRQDDSFSWFLAACGTRGLPAPQPVADHFFRLRPMGPNGKPQGSRFSLDGAAFLLQAMRMEESWLAQRAWREWQRGAEQQLDDMPRDYRARVAWVNRWAEALAASR